jgi:hypothetical protein
LNFGLRFENWVKRGENLNCIKPLSGKEYIPAGSACITFDDTLTCLQLLLKNYADAAADVLSL